MKTSSIGWTDFSGGPANIVTRGSRPGDCEVSAGCANCYVLRMPFARRWLPQTTTCYPERLARLARTRVPEFSPKRGAPHKPMAFVADCGDLFHPAVPETFIAQALDVMASREDVVWQVLTKRPERLLHVAHWMAEYWPGDSPFMLWWECLRHWPANIWFGVSVEDQATAETRIPPLLEVPAAVRFVSVEPMLGPVTLVVACDVVIGQDYDVPAVEGWERWIHWVIVGAESGKGRRPFCLWWAEDLYAQCAAAGVPFFGKQDSGAGPGEPLELPIHGVVQQWPEQCAVCSETIPVGHTVMIEAATGRQAHMRCEGAFAAMIRGESGDGDAPAV